MRSWLLPLVALLCTPTSGSAGSFSTRVVGETLKKPRTCIIDSMSHPWSSVSNSNSWRLYCHRRGDYVAPKISLVPKASVICSSSYQKSMEPWELTPDQVTADVPSAASSSSSRPFAPAGATILGIESVKEHQSDKFSAVKDPNMILFMQIKMCYLGTAWSSLPSMIQKHIKVGHLRLGIPLP